MPSYDYICEHCEYQDEIFHMMSDESPQICPHCNKPMNKQISAGYAFVKNPDNTASEMRDRSERAKDRRSQPKHRTHDGVGSGKGKALGGQHFEVDKKEFIQAAAKDPLMVKTAQDALKKSNENNI